MLALNLAGSELGWALRSGPEGRVTSGVHCLELCGGESPGMRFLRFRRWLRELCAHARLGTDAVLAYERAHQWGAHVTELRVGLQTEVLAMAAQLGCEVAIVHTATLKRWATGNERAQQGAMVGAAKRLFPKVAIFDHHHAEALCLLALTVEDSGEWWKP